MQVKEILKSLNFKNTLQSSDFYFLNKTFLNKLKSPTLLRRNLKTSSGVHFLNTLKQLYSHPQVFFVLRKKNNQVTFLHVYHHGCLVVACYFYIKFLTGGGQPILLGAINSFVHVVMYTYYFFTSYKPELKKSLWFKRHITELQMLQFAILFFHLMIPVVTECDYPKGLSAALAFQNVFMFILFGDFYYKAYIRKR